jgi:hypothetical protein
MKGTDLVFRIENLYETGDAGRFRLMTGKPGYYYEANYCRHATPQEIETHLRKICDEKYVGKKVDTIYGYTDTPLRFSNYVSSTDELVYFSKDMYSITIYKQGKFAELVPDEFKELPKTIEEIEALMIKYGESIFNNNLPFRCDAVNKFLVEQGYKTD